jgi:hypothetical protein
MGYLKILLFLLWLYRHFASWAMSHRHRLLGQCRNTALPSLAISILFLLNYLPLGLLCLLGLPLELLCLLVYSASWATFTSWATWPLGLLLPLGLASWATLPLGLLCLFGLYIDTLPLRLCLIDIVSFDNASILICLLGCFNMLPLGPYLIDIVCFDNADILIWLLDCAIAGHLLICKNDKTC